MDPTKLRALGSEPEEELKWQKDALCAQTDPETFFPEKGSSVRDAKKICAGCEVRAQCLEYALANDERFGVWGGLSERERRNFRTKIGAIASGNGISPER
ncbi:MAG TPA: WhiB family transcriptional regulator [Candidatus Saccharibacteria bacterium]|nr:WhiB family transcriptional regulator [Candidatus Saccharibacteria bacterium]HRQ98185.1 WhiB family transcriptional regulator [Candidatus Saccharibacteria bacterium]